MLFFYLLVYVNEIMMSKKSAHPKISIHSASQRAPLNLNVNYVTVMKFTCTYQISYKTEMFKTFIACTSTWIFC